MKTNDNNNSHKVLSNHKNGTYRSKDIDKKHSDVDKKHSDVDKIKKESKQNFFEIDIYSKEPISEDLSCVIKSFYQEQENDKYLNNIGIKNLNHFFEVIGSVLSDKIKNKYISFNNGKFYSKISNGNGELIESEINYLDDLLKSGSMKQLLDFHKVRTKVMKNDEKILKEIGMTKDDFMGIMKTSIANNALISFRPISEYAKYLLESGAMGKLFHTKGKSSVIGPIKGIVPYLSCFSKASRKIDGENNFEINKIRIEEFQKKNDSDINSSNLEFYKLMLITIMGDKHRHDVVSKFDKIQTYETDINPILFNQILLKEISCFCQENQMQNIADIFMKDNSFRDNEDIKKDLLNLALENITEEKNKKDFVNTIDNFNFSSRKAFEVSFCVDGADKKYQLYFAAEDENPLYEKNSYQIEDNQRPLFFIMEGDDLYQYNYDYVAGNGLEGAQYIKLDNQKKNQYRPLLKKVEAFSYCKYQYDANTNSVIEIKRPAAADYDMLSAVSQKIFPLELNSKEEIVGELKYFQFQEAMSDIKFLITLKNICNGEVCSSDDEEFMIRKIRESRITSESNNSKKLENLERILTLKFSGGRERTAKVKNFIEKEIAVFQQGLDRSEEINSFFAEVCSVLKLPKVENYENCRTVFETLLASNNEDLKKKYNEILKKYNLSSFNKVFFDKFNLSPQTSRKVQEAIKNLQEIKEVSNLEEMEGGIRNLINKMKRRMTKVTAKNSLILEEILNHPDMRYYLESKTKSNESKDKKFLLEQLGCLEGKIGNNVTNIEVSKDVENKKLLILERFTERVKNSETLNDTEKNIVKTIIDEFGANLLGEKYKSDLLFSEVDFNKEIGNLMNKLFPESKSKKLMLSFEAALNKMFKGETISKNDKNTIAENFIKLEKYRKLEIAKSKIYEDLSGVTTINDRVFVAALKFDANGNINHGMEYGNPCPEPFGDGNFAFLLPEGDVRLVKNEQQVCELVNELRGKGYPVMINVKWGWVSNEEGKLSIPKNKFDFIKIEKEIAIDKKNISLNKSLDLNQKFKQGNNNFRSMIPSTKEFLKPEESEFVKMVKKSLNLFKSMNKGDMVSVLNLLLDQYKLLPENRTNFDDKLKKIEESSILKGIPGKDLNSIKSIFVQIKKLFKENQDIIENTLLPLSDEVLETLLYKETKEITEKIDQVNKNAALILDKIENLERIVGAKSQAKKMGYFVDFKELIFDSIFIDRDLNEEEVAKILEEQSYIYNLYLHICNIETSPRMFYGKSHDHLIFKNDQNKNDVVLDKDLHDIKNKVQKNFFDEDRQKISELRSILNEKWTEYCQLSGCKAIFKESGFDKEFKKVVIPSNNPAIKKIKHLFNSERGIKI